jgi:hypothetical protein
MDNCTEQTFALETWGEPNGKEHFDFLCETCVYVGRETVVRSFVRSCVRIRGYERRTKAGNSLT